MAITKNKIATRRACNNISTVVNAGFSGELDQCPTKSEINATKKIIVLESGVRSNDRNLTANYSDNQCIKEEDIGHYVKLDYEYDLPGSAKVNFHKDRVNTSNFDASVTEYFTAFTNSMSTGNGTNEVALTPSFFEQGWGSDLEITVSYGSSTSDVQQMFINSYPGTKSSDGTYFKWNNSNSSLIMSGLASRTMKLVVTETAADVITYGIVMSPTTISNMTQGSTKQLTVKYYKYVNGLADQTSMVDVTSQCSYEVSNTAVTVSSSGLVTAGNKGGSATITATYNGYTDTTSVNVDYVITMTVNNLQQIVSAEHGEDGVDDVIVFVDDSGNRINVGLTYDLYYFEGDCDNTVSGPVSAWQELYDNYSYVYLGDYDDKGIISEDLEDGQWDTIYEFITSAKEDCEDKSFSIDWPMRTSPTTTYELEVTPNSSTIEIGESTQFTATYWTLEKGERTTSIDVTSDATWTSSDSTLATVDKGYVTGINQGVDIEITATYNTVSDTSWVEVAEPETVSIPVTFSAENWGNSGQECDIMISARLYNYKTQQSQPICSNKHIVVGDAGNGRPAYYETLATVQINPDEKSDWNMQLWGYPYSCTSGVFSVNLMSPLSDRYYQIIQDIDTDTDWQTADSYPYEGSLSNYYEGDSIDIYFRGDY